MTKIAQNFRICVGDTKQVRVDVVDAAGVAVVDFEDHVAEIVWSGAGLEKKLSDGDILLVPGASAFVILFQPDDTTALDFLFAGYPHACTVTDWAGNVSTVMRGEVFFPPLVSANIPILLDGEVDEFSLAATQDGIDVPVYAFFTSSGSALAGETITVDVWEVGIKVVAGAAATEIADGLYQYVHTTTTDFLAVFHCANPAADVIDMPSLGEHATHALADILTDLAALPVPVYAFFTSSGGVALSGETITVDVLAGGVAVVTGAAATAIGGGFYMYTYTATADFLAVFHCTNPGADKLDVPALGYYTLQAVLAAR